MSHSLQQEILSIIGKTKEIHMNQLDMFEALSNYGIDSLDMINILLIFKIDMILRLVKHLLTTRSGQLLIRFSIS